MESIPGKYLRIWHKLDVDAIVFGRFLYPFLEKISFGILRPGTFPITVGRNIEVDGERVGYFNGMNGNFLPITPIPTEMPLVAETTDSSGIPLP